MAKARPPRMWIVMLRAGDERVPTLFTDEHEVVLRASNGWEAWEVTGLESVRPVVNESEGVK